MIGVANANVLRFGVEAQGLVAAQLRRDASVIGGVVAVMGWTGEEVGPEEGAAKGWLHFSALTKKKIVLQPGSADIEEAATSDELALAGKGFNKQMEEQFSSDNPNADYAWIDWMEQIVVSQDEMTRFQEEGGLSPKGGSR